MRNIRRRLNVFATCRLSYRTPNFASSAFPSAVLYAVTCAPTGTTQINDVFVDEREVVYCVDRHIGGLYCLEMDF